MDTSPTPYRVTILAFRLLLALVFLLAGASKVGQPWVFVHTVEQYQLLPEGVARPFALALPWVELLVGFYLLIGLFTRVTAMVASALLLLFICALATQLARGTTAIGCGCFSGLSGTVVGYLSGGNTIGAWDLIRDGLLLLMALAIAATPRPLLAVDAWLSARRAVALDDECRVSSDIV
jgi:uncharacterized membrane protein YphA (DoxX/SURF4 family)